VAADTYTLGMAAVVAFIFAALFALTLIDIYFHIRRWPSIGYRVEHWSLSNAWFSAGILLVVGMFLAHFLLNPFDVRL